LFDAPASFRPSDSFLRGVTVSVTAYASPGNLWLACQFIWTLKLDEGRTKIGVSFSKANAIFNAISAIDKALSVLSKAK
jgi:hypothetical protein